MIIIPDVHGRNFWKEAVKERKPRETVVFLGDYLDPYSYEWESGQDTDLEYPTAPEKAFDIWKEVWTNFNEIIEYKKKNPSTTILLLGNHDVHYIYSYGGGSRYDYFHSRQIGNKFNENKNLFQLAYEKKIGRKRFIFSHAGIHKLWIEDWFGDVVTKKNVVDYLNNAYLTEDVTLERALDQYSVYRGGFESYGSMVWADMREWYGAKESAYGDVQIFGHTQLKGTPVNFNDAFYNLDVRRAFRINESGEVCEMDGTVVPKLKI